MPTGPKGQKRPADVIGMSVKVMRIATGEEEEELDRAKSAAAELGALGGKARALLKGRAHVTIDDIRTLAYPTLRHRLLLNYRAEAEGVNVEKVIERLIETIETPIK